MAEKSSATKSSSGNKTRSAGSSSGAKTRGAGSSAASKTRSARSSGASKNGQKDPVELAGSAVRTLAQLTGHAPESILGLKRSEEGWQVLIEVLEMQRVPNSTDVLGCYAVDLDKDGQVVGYQRRRRYQRAQTGGDDL